MLMYYETEKIAVRYPKTANNVMSWSMVNPGTKNYNVHLNSRTIPKEFIGWLNSSTSYDTRIYLTIGQIDKIWLSGDPEYVKLGTVKITFNVKFRLRDQAAEINRKDENMTIQQKIFMKQASSSSISFGSASDETNKSLIPENVSPNESKADKELLSFLSLDSGSKCNTLVQAKAVKSTKIEKFKQEMEDQAGYVQLIYQCFNKINPKWKCTKNVGYLSSDGAAYINNYIINNIKPNKVSETDMKSLRLIIESLPKLTNYKTCAKMKFIKNNLMNYYDYLKSPKSYDVLDGIVQFNPKDIMKNHNKAYFDTLYNEQQRQKKDKELKDYRDRMEKRAEIRDIKTDQNRDLNNKMAADRLIQGRTQHLDRMDQCRRFHNENLERSNQSKPEFKERKPKKTFEEELDENYDGDYYRWRQDYDFLHE
jgi:uncharacterized protein (UPF0297 family)